MYNANVLKCQKYGAFDNLEKDEAEGKRSAIVNVVSLLSKCGCLQILHPDLISTGNIEILYFFAVSSGPKVGRLLAATTRPTVRSLTLTPGLTLTLVVHFY